VSELVGKPLLRFEERRRNSNSSQKPPRIARFSDERLFSPSDALSIHSNTFPPCPCVRQALNPASLVTSAGDEVTPLKTAVGMLLLAVG